MKKILPLLLLAMSLQGCWLQKDENLIFTGILISAWLAIYGAINTIHGPILKLIFGLDIKDDDSKRVFSAAITIIFIIVCGILCNAKG